MSTKSFFFTANSKFTMHSTGFDGETMITSWGWMRSRAHAHHVVKIEIYGNFIETTVFVLIPFSTQNINKYIRMQTKKPKTTWTNGFWVVFFSLGVLFVYLFAQPWVCACASISTTLMIILNWDKNTFLFDVVISIKDSFCCLNVKPCLHPTYVIKFSVTLTMRFDAYDELKRTTANNWRDHDVKAYRTQIWWRSDRINTEPRPHWTIDRHQIVRYMLQDNKYVHFMFTDRCCHFISFHSSSFLSIND